MIMIMNTKEYKKRSIRNLPIDKDYNPAIIDNAFNGNYVQLWSSMVINFISSILDSDETPTMHTKSYNIAVMTDSERD